MIESAEERSRRWFDTTINLQTLCGALVGAAIAICIGWFSLVGRVDKLEGKDIAHEERMGRIEREQQLQRADVKDQVRGVQEQVTGVAGDVKEILRYLRDSGASKRPEISRWTK